MIKIPVLDTIASAYRFTFGQLGAIIGLIWIPQLLASVIEYVTSRPFALRIMAGDSAEAAGKEHLLAMAGEGVVFFLMAVMAVAVTRQALGLRQGPAIAYFAFGKPEARVFGGLLAMGFLGGASLLVMLLLSGLMGKIPGQAGQLAASVALLVLGGALTYAMTRLTALQVPASLAHADYGIERSWLMTRGNFWRLLAVILACIGPVFLVTRIVFVIAAGPDSFPKDFSALQNEQALMDLQARQLLLAARSQPLMVGLDFALAPFKFGLAMGAAAAAFKFLSGAQPQAAQNGEHST
jgi:hypothetical protein